ncbi:MAG: hypothetical protein KJ720_09970 [Proteobacteria bacterium]|nr:hypothetical protein [Pseudomonadota bacterium]MBU1452415.1 hypothetical protein [Pseudomonadota bacterium]MBU2467682.1 hypothetical protein [Pseudomonadota bacterium]MBU2518234.1 hypothetical protein [Pseudomonadota bacterium]
MGQLIPNEIEKYLDNNLSHLISRLDQPELQQRIKNHLINQGVEITHESILSDAEGARWSVFSLREKSARPLVVDLIENGFPPDIRGIDARPRREGQGTARLEASRVVE